MQAVASQSFEAYFVPMFAVILRLLTLLALALMPFGMGAAMASSGHHAVAAASIEHCGEHGGQPVKQSPHHAADCAIACSMLLNAETRIQEPVPTVRLPAARPLAETSAGLHPETATPPPKPS